MYVDTQHLAPMLACTPAEWTALTQHAEREGRIVFTRYLYNGKVSVRVSTLEYLSLQGYCGSSDTPGYRLLLKLVQRPEVLRNVLLVCQPFVSSAEAKQGCKKVVVKSRHDNSQYSTTVLPRLQLKLKSLDDVNCVGECRKLLDDL